MRLAWGGSALRGVQKSPTRYPKFPPRETRSFVLFQNPNSERDQWIVLGFSGKSTLHAARPKWRLGEINCEPSAKHCIGSMAKSSRPSTSPYSASALIEGTERSGRKVESEMSTERPCTEPIRWGITAGLHCAGISVCSIPN